MTTPVERRLERLEAFETARTQTQRYAQKVDACDLAAVSALFADNATLATPMGSFQGREAIEGFFRQAWAADPSTKKHFIFNQSLRYLGEGVVEVESALLYLGRATHNSLIGWGSYLQTIDTNRSDGMTQRLEIRIDHSTSLDDGWALENPEQTP